MKKNPKANNRREFIKKTALTSLGISIIPRHVMGKGFIAPSDKLNIAVIGGGGKGYSDALNAWNNGASNIAAICDVDWNQSKRLMDKFPDALKYKDYRKLFDDIKDIDAVTVSTPDHTHAVIAMAAIKSGKHVHVQKPLTHSIYEARMLTEAANKRMLALVSPRGTKVTKSAMAKGWIVSLGGSGVYNYVTYKQIDKGIYEDQEIIDQAISNFIKDQEALEVIKVNQE